MKICLKCEKPSSVQGEQKCIHCGGMLVEASVLEKFKNAATIRAPKSLHQEVQSFGPQVKQGLITVAGAIFLAVLSAGITFFVQRSVYVKENDRLKNDSRDLQMDNATLRAKINDRTDELQKTRTERDEAQEELAPWIQLANTQLTNTPLSERLDKLLDILRADLGARSRSVANLPLIYVTSMLGHPTSWTNNPDYRLHSLVVRNESDVEINNFCSRLQLPEPILQTLMTNCIV